MAASSVLKLGLCLLVWLIGFSASFFPLFFIKIYPYSQAQFWPTSNCTIDAGVVNRDCGFFSFGYSCGLADSRPVFTVWSTARTRSPHEFQVHYPVNSSYTQYNGSAFVNLYGAVGVGGYMPASDAVTFLSTYKVGESYQCWYNPAAPNIASLVNGYDYCMITTIVGVGIGDGVGGLLVVVFVILLIAYSLRQVYEKISERL